MKNQEKTDLRVIKTHRYIRRALVDLLQDKSFREITVNDILQKAMVNRTTFYRYYSGKSDLAAKMIADFKLFFAQKIDERLNATDLNLFYRQLIPIIFEERRQLLALWEIQTTRLHLYQDMKDMAKDFVVRLLKQRQADPHYIDYQSTVFASMMLESIRYHFELNQLPDPKVTIKKIQEVLSIVSY